MRKWMLMLVACSMFLIGCSEKTYEPRDIVSETDVCQICNMSIVHNDFAGQIVLKNGDVEMFDDIGCLMEYIDANGEDELGAAFIKDAIKDEWINTLEAIYVYNKEYWTPMNYGVLAFDTNEAANSWMQKEGQGKVLTYTDLQAFNWGIHQ